jgi:hypothetical protein
MLKADRLILIICIFYFILISGCAAFNPIVTHYENNFSDFKASQQDLIKTTSIKKQFNKSFDEVWNSALYILAQHAIIIDATKESGIIIYVSIDGIHFGDVFPEDSIYYWEFPFTALIDRGSNSVTVSIYPMRNLYDEKDKKKNWWKIINAGFNQNGEEFIERLSTQLTTQERWQWLK